MGKYTKHGKVLFITTTVGVMSLVPGMSYLAPTPNQIPPPNETIISQDIPDLFFIKEPVLMPPVLFGTATDLAVF